MDGSVFLKCRFHPESRISWPPFSRTYGVFSVCAAFTEGHIFVPWRALKLCAQLRVPASRKCIFVRCCAQSRNRVEKRRTNAALKRETDEGLPTERPRVGEEGRQRQKEKRETIRKRAQDCNFSPHCSRQSFFFCEVLMTSRSGCIGRPSALELARYACGLDERVGWTRRGTNIRYGGCVA